MTLLTIQDAADRLQMSTGWIRLAIRKGELPASYFGRYVRIHPDDLEAYRIAKLRKNEGTTASDDELSLIKLSDALYVKSTGYRR